MAEKEKLSEEALENVTGGTGSADSGTVSAGQFYTDLHFAEYLWIARVTRVYMMQDIEVLDAILYELDSTQADAVGKRKGSVQNMPVFKFAVAYPLTIELSETTKQSIYDLDT